MTGKRPEERDLRRRGVAVLQRLRRARHRVMMTRTARDQALADHWANAASVDRLLDVEVVDDEVAREEAPGSPSTGQERPVHGP